MAREINLNHIAKIEGHAHLTLKIDKNQVKKCELKAAEGARFFEALVINRRLQDIQEIVSRICGICSCAHSVAAVQGLEEALNIKPTEEQIFIREMLMLGERIRSHATHLYFLSLPDYLGATSALTLGKEHRSKINDALKIITAGNKIVEIFGGREMHPFLDIKEDLEKVDYSPTIKNLEELKPLIKKTITLFRDLDYPKMSRTSDFLCLKDPDEYAIISGKVNSNTGVFTNDEYKKHLKENIKEYATSKFVLKEGEPYMLGSMARINNNYENLDVESKDELNKALKKLKLTLPLKDPHHNLICQAVEILQAVNSAINYLSNPPKGEVKKDLKIRAGEAVTAVEAPRGTLFHEYKIDREGKVTYCNIITPTAQNLNMMEKDIKTLVNRLLEEKNSKEEIVTKVEKLIRAYDPCFSCSTHFLKVDWL